MIDPLIAIMYGLAIIVIFIIIFLPRWGIVALFRRLQKNIDRVLVEDALKHIYDYESNQLQTSTESISINLSITKEQAEKISNRLEQMGLIDKKENSLILTSEGRSYALRVIRIHRLLERYMADETSVKESDWHSEAEEKEHAVSIEEANALAAQLGNPLYDPHGDPIPTDSGELPERKGISLSALKPGEFAIIIHIEDEPETVYAQIAAMGLFNGMQVRMIESSGTKIKFEADGEEYILAPIIAANITVIPLTEKEDIIKDFKTLSSLKMNEEAVVVGIAKSCRGQQRRRLMDFGVVPGTKIKPIIRSIGSDPTGYIIRGATVALRKKQSDQIYIKTTGGIK